MSLTTLTGRDTITLFGRVLNDFLDGDVAQLTYPNNIIEMKSGKNGNTVYSENATGRNADLTLRLARGGSDDRFLQGKMTQQLQDPTSFVLATGQIVKNMGDGQGNRVLDVYTLIGGVFRKRVETTENTEGATEQGVAVYTMSFADAPRTPQ